MDKRHKKRTKYVQEIYSLFFGKTIPVSDKTKEIIGRSKELDEKIRHAAPKYATEKIAKVDMAILRLAIYELCIEKIEPPKVIINEAVELAHEMGSSRSPAFVNAVLGLIYEKTSK